MSHAFRVGRLVAASVVLWCSAGLMAGEGNLGQRIENFSLHDFRGKLVSLSDYAESPAVAVVFFGVECPLARQYAPRLEELQREFADRGVALIGIDSNQQDSLAEIAAFAREYDLHLPLLKDPGNEVADRFGAQRTPEAFVLDRNRVVRYRGRIDDQYGLGTGSGYARPQIRRRDMATAIEELLAGKAVSQPTIDATGCFIGRVKKADPSGNVTYSEHIAGILQERCVKCHRPGEIGPFSLTDYDESVGWAETIRQVVSEKRMPPWFANPAHGNFLNDNQMTDAERNLVYAWVDGGCPQGDPSQMPAPKQFVEGWQIGQPDQIVQMPDVFNVAAEGPLDYINFTADPGWTEDKWLQAVEVRPENRAVVHHIILNLRTPPRADGSRNQAAAAGGNIGGFAPGSGSRVLPPGVAIYVPAGSKIIFQMHYTPNGLATTDRSYAAFKFADPKDVTRRAQTSNIANSSFVIPPGADNHEVRSQLKFNKDMRLLWLAPHMHLRGKDYRYTAVYPDGTSEILLDVPHYDFNWQLRYLLTEPKLLPAGTVVHCLAHFDNSDNNLANPDPTDTVKYGPQTWHEMMIGWFGAMPDQEDLTADATLEKANAEADDAAFERPQRGRNRANEEGTN